MYLPTRSRQTHLSKAGPWLPDALPPATGALGPPLPNLANRFPAAPVPTDDPRTDRLRVVQGVRSLLSSLGAAVLVVEDMHWVDEATRELLLLPSMLRKLGTTRGGVAARLTPEERAG